MLPQRLMPINAATLRQAHAPVESGTTRGKSVEEGFGAQTSTSSSRCPNVIGFSVSWAMDGKA